jgi:DNA-binding CsgD family transcriptional regulator
MVNTVAMATRVSTLKTQGPLLLTQRQQAVLEGIARRKTIKVIAHQLGVSESAINQQIRVLKSLFEAADLSELSHAYQLYSNGKTNESYRKPAYRKKQLPQTSKPKPDLQADDVGMVLTFNDALVYHQSAPWDEIEAVRVVPEVLNGAYGKWVRLGLIVLVTFGIFATVIVGLGAAKGVSSALAAWRSASESNR